MNSFRFSGSLLLLILFAQSANAQQQAPQLTVVPPKPTCTLIFKTGSCADLWNAYNDAVARRQQEEIQLYVNRQKELASQAAAAPLQKQIDDLTKLSSDQQVQITKLHEQMKSDATAALERQADAHQQGLYEGVGIGAVGLLILIGIVMGIRRFSSNFSITRKQPA